MKIRIGNDIRLRVNVSLNSKNNITTKTTLLYTAAIGGGEDQPGFSIVIPDPNNNNISNSVLYRLYCQKGSNNLLLKYNGLSTTFNYVLTQYTTDDESGIEDYNSVRAEDIMVGTLDDIKRELIASHSSEQWPSIPFAIVAWTDEPEPDTAIEVYDVANVYTAEAPLNIQSIKAYLINTTEAEKHLEDLKNKTRFLGRFPIEPFLDEYTPTAYNINCSGYPKYHTLVANRYGGFGIYPKWKNIIPHKARNDYKFLASVYRTENSNEIDVMFPAIMLRRPGKYSLLLVVKLYEYGYSNTNTRTITTDYPDALELVSTTAEADFDGSTTLDLRQIDSSEVIKVKTGDDIYTYKGEYEDGNITLELTNGTNVGIDVTGINDWYEGD